MSLHLVTGHEGTEHIMAADQGSFNIAAFGGGQYVMNHGYKFEATIINSNTVRIKDGDLLMQGRHMRLSAGSTEELTIDTGTQGMLRKDLIVARYSKNSSTGVESAALMVLKGTEAASSPVDPEYNVGTITDGTDLINDFPLYRVSLNGTDMTLSDPLFEVRTGIGDITDTLSNILDGTTQVASATHATSADSAATATSATTAENASTAGSATTAGSADNDIVIANQQALTFTNKVCTISDARITAASLADVYFTNACMAAAKKANITVETSSGAVTLTAERTPESTLTATVKIRVV